MTRMSLEIPIGPVLQALGCKNVPPEGNWRAINCVNPEHDDTNASASTNGYGYKCHACGLKGNAVTVVMEINRCERPGALKFIEEVFGGSIPKISTESNRGRRRISFGREGANRGDDNPVSTGIRRRPLARP